MEISPEMMKEMVETKVAFLERMGLKALEMQPRHVKLMAPLKGNESHIGTVYAGALFTLAEVPGGALFLTSFDISKYYPIVKEVTIRFVRLAKTDVTVELGMSQEEVNRIQAEADDKGKADFTLECEVKDTSGEVVAVSKGLYQIRVIGA